MNIESELPDDFNDLSDEKKVAHLERLERKIDDSDDSGAVKKRMIQELKRKYSS